MLRSNQLTDVATHLTSRRPALQLKDLPVRPRRHGSDFKIASNGFGARFCCSGTVISKKRSVEQLTPSPWRAARCDFGRRFPWS